MSDAELLDKVSRLPEDLKAEVADFVKFLIEKKKNKPEKLKPVFGSGKGMFVMSEDFDEPIEDFKEYM